MCKKVAIVGLFQVQNHYNKLFDKKFNTHLFINIKDNSCDNNTSKSEIKFFMCLLCGKIFSYFLRFERARKSFCIYIV